MAKTAVMIRLDPDVLSKLDAAAKVLDRSRANVCLLALKDYLEMVDNAHEQAERTAPKGFTPPSPEECAHPYRNPSNKCMVCGHQR